MYLVNAIDVQLVVVRRVYAGSRLNNSGRYVQLVEKLVRFLAMASSFVG